MAYMPWIAIILFILLIIVSAIAYFSLKISREEYKRTGKHPKGHYIGIGMALGVAIGAALGFQIGIPSHNDALGPIGMSIGIAVGLSIGAYFEKKHERELRELTKKEKRLKNNIILFLIGTTVLGLIVMAAIAFLAVK